MEVTALKESSEDVQHFADRIFTKRGARYRRVAMSPTSATTTRRPKAQLTIVTTWLHVRSGSTTALTALKRDFRSVPESRHSQCSLACLKRAKPRTWQI
jgi:hypothetical protein